MPRKKLEHSQPRTSPAKQALVARKEEVEVMQPMMSKTIQQETEGAEQGAVSVERAEANSRETGTREDPQESILIICWPNFAFISLWIDGVRLTAPVAPTITFQVPSAQLGCSTGRRGRGGAVP